MARVRKPDNDKVVEMENELKESDGFPFDPAFTVTDVNEMPQVKQPTRRMGGPTGGDLKGGGKGPVIGETHAADDQTADHYGSREETQAALEGKIASQNTLKLHQH